MTKSVELLYFLLLFLGNSSHNQTGAQAAWKLPVDQQVGKTTHRPDKWNQQVEWQKQVRTQHIYAQQKKRAGCSSGGSFLSFLEKKVEEMEEQRQVEVKMLQEEKEQLRSLILRQTAIIGELERQLLKVSSNNTALQRQQQELLDTVNDLIRSISDSSARGESALQPSIKGGLALHFFFFGCL